MIRFRKDKLSAKRQNYKKSFSNYERKCIAIIQMMDVKMKKQKVQKSVSLNLESEYLKSEIKFRDFKNCQGANRFENKIN